MAPALPYVLPEAGPVVATGAGPVRGVWREHDGVRTAAFLAVPFAAAPVGGLRFAAPQPVEPWAQLRDCSGYGPTPQRRPLADVTFIPEPSVPGDDTLSVNVFTPAPGDGARPVLVWIHGGGYVGGSPASPWYDGRSFARDGVVVVTCSYRLGFDGFGVLPDAPANRAVLDWLAVLRWVRDEVAAFGGDPGRVTIAGQSAGGGAVTTLLVTPAARGLFHGAIPQSGAFGPAPLASGLRTTRRVARALGLDGTAGSFVHVANDELTAAAEPSGDDPLADARSVLAGASGLGLSPVVDGETIPRSLEEALADGSVADVPVLAGATAHEFTRLSPEALALLGDRTPSDALDALGLPEHVRTELLAAYPDDDAAFLVGQGMTDRIFRQPTGRLVRGLADAGRRAWLYDVRWPVPSSGLAEHCCELPFVWDVLDADGVERSCGANPPQELADEVHARWVGFVRTGDPGWEPVRPRERGALTGAIVGEPGAAPLHEGRIDIR